MRATYEIIADLKDGKEVPYEELKMACLVQSSIIFFFRQNTKHLLKGGTSAELVKQMDYKDSETSSQELGCPSWYWTAMKADPLEYLGPRLIPGTPEWKEMHEAHMKLYRYAMKKHTEQN